MTTSRPDQRLSRPAVREVAPTPAGRRGSPRPGLVRLLPPLVAVVVLAVLWQIVAVRNRSLIPSLGAVWTELVTRPGFYAGNLGNTLISALSGLALSLACALLLATLLVHVRSLRAALLPIAVLINGTPVVAIAPALIVAFGFGRLPHILVAAIITFFPLLVNALTGLETVNPAALAVFQSLGASRSETYLRLRLPSSLPYLFAALKVGASLAMVGAVVSEFTGSTGGIGAVIVSSTTYLNLPQLWAAIAVSAAASIGLLGATTLLERLVLRW